MNKFVYCVITNEDTYFGTIKAETGDDCKKKLTEEFSNYTVVAMKFEGMGSEYFSKYKF